MTSGSIWRELSVQAQGSAPAHLSRAHHLQGVTNNNASCNICLGSAMGAGTKALKYLEISEMLVVLCQGNVAESSASSIIACFLASEVIR